jgi:hypothetical protein
MLYVPILSAKGALFASRVLQQTFYNLWNATFIQANDTEEKNMFQYRLNWMSALTGWQTKATQYSNDKHGELRLFVDLMKCNRVPCTIITKANPGALPINIDFTVSAGYNLFPGMGIQTMETFRFHLYDPFTRLEYSANAWKILQQINYLISPFEGNLPLYDDLATGLSPAPGPRTVSEIANQLAQLRQ